MTPGSELIAYCLTSVLGVLLLVTSRHGRSMCACLVGGSAALQSAQIASVHAFSLVVAAYVVTVLTRNGGFHGPLKSLLIPGVTVSLASTVLFGDLVHKPSIAGQLLVLATSGAAVAITATRCDWIVMIRAFLAVITMASIASFLQFVQILPYPPFYGANRPNGLVYLEPDWLGMYAAVGMMLSTMIVSRRLLSMILTLINAGAVILAGARGPWIAIAVCTAAMLVVQAISHRGSATVRRLIRYVSLAAVGGLVAVATSPGLWQNVQERISSLSDPAHGDAGTYARTRQNYSLLSLAESSPWYGHGLSASGRVGAYGEIDFSASVANAVGSNWLVSWWIEGGLLALPVIAFLWIVGLARIARGFGIVLVLVLICNLFSNSSYLPVVWFIVALNVSVSDCAEVTGRVHRESEAARTTAEEFSSATRKGGVVV